MSSPPVGDKKNTEIWNEFKLRPIETAVPLSSRSKSDFVPIKPEGYGEGVFTLYEGYSTGQHVEKSPEDFLNEIKEAVELRESEGYERGFIQGEKDGFELGEQKSIKVLENMERFFESVRQMKPQILKQYEKEILDIIFSIARKITHVQIGLNHQVIRETIINCIECATEKSEVILRIHPDDFNYVEKIRPELFDKFKAMKSIQVKADSTMERGGCILETPCGDIDARIETQLEKIAESLDMAFSECSDE